MIHTPRRTAAPAKLLRYRHKWSARFSQICTGDRQGEWATPLAKKVIRESLLAMSHGKCVYCESALGVTSEAHIEHYHARMLRQEAAFEWSNLLPACGICNGSKAAEDHGGRLLKPDDEDPEPFFWIHPDSGKLEPHPALNEDQRERAEKTIRLCNLQRGALCTQRIEMMKRVSRWAMGMATEIDVAEWNDLAHPATQYKFVLRHVLTQKGLASLAEEDRRRFLSAPG
jgi:uncharacterized protein (TIGR02646 family)